MKKLNWNGLRYRTAMRPEAGFTLVEVAVSIIILCVGLLGVVSLQAAALKSNRETKNQEIAVQLAREFSDMVRGNRVIGSDTSASNNPYLQDDRSLVARSPSYCLSVGSSCSSSTAVANAEMTDWLSRVAAQLPGARVATCFDTAPLNAGGLPQWPCTAPSSGVSAPMVVKIGWTRLALNKSLTGPAALDYATNPAIALSFEP